MARKPLHGKPTKLPPRPYDDFKNDQRLIEHKDAGGTYWEIKDPLGGTLEVFWTKTMDHLIVRQENETNPTVDMLELTHGQAYDLLRAVARAMESTK